MPCTVCMTVCMTVCTVCSEPAESLVVQDLPTNRTKRHTKRHTNRARRLGNSYEPYKPLRFGVLESKPPWCTVCTVCTNSLGAVHGLYDGLYDGTVCRMAATYLHCRRGRRSCGVCNSQPPRFFGSPCGGHVFPRSRARPLGGGNCERS